MTSLDNIVAMQSSIDYHALIHPFWSLPKEELNRAVELLSEMMQLREKCEGGSPSAPTAAGIVDALPALPKRKPMKEPKEGTLRALVRQVLIDAGEPIRRAEVIQKVAEKKGIEVDPVLQVKVGDVLNHAHDPFFIKVKRGVYAAR